jgi:ankyrin repeat protein
VCRYLIDIGLDVNAKSRRGTPLHLFLAWVPVGLDLKNGIAQLLLDCGADVRAVDDKGCTALHAACSHDIPARHRFLVEAGVDINAVNHDGCTALHLAANRGHLETVQYLVEAGADVKATDSSGATVFEYASKCLISEWGGSIQSYLRTVGAPVPEKFCNQ